jgi:hypothetical protein
MAVGIESTDVEQASLINTKKSTTQYIEDIWKLNSSVPGKSSVQITNTKDCPIYQTFQTKIPSQCSILA